MKGIRDVHGSARGYKNAREAFIADKTLPAHNRELALKWVEKKEKSLYDGLNVEERKANELRVIKTLTKYLFQSRNVCRWFPDLRHVTEKELLKVKEDLFNGKLEGSQGRPITGAGDYVKKIFKGNESFFTFIGNADIANKVFSAKVRKPNDEVQYIEEVDLKKILLKVRGDANKTAIRTLFYSGLRAAEFLNLKKADFEEVREKGELKRYMVHVREETSKSKQDRTIPLTDPQTVEDLSNMLESLTDGAYVFKNTYRRYAEVLHDAAEEARVYCRPKVNEQVLPHVHILRKSTTIYWLNNGFNSDQIKAFMGHKPSSSVIDCYLNYKGTKYTPQLDKIEAGHLQELKQELNEKEAKLRAQQAQIDQSLEEMKRRERDSQRRFKAMEAKLLQKILKKVKN